MPSWPYIILHIRDKWTTAIGCARSERTGCRGRYGKLLDKCAAPISDNAFINHMHELMERGIQVKWHLGCSTCASIHTMDTWLYYYQSAWRVHVLLTTRKWITHPEVTFCTFTLWGFCTSKFQHGGQNSWSTRVRARCQQSQREGFWAKN